MRLVANLDELTRAVGSVPRSGMGYTTNFFASPTETEQWIHCGSLSLLEADQAILMLHRNARFFRLYHVAPDADTLSAALGALGVHMSDATIVTDLIGTQQSLDTVVAAYVRNAFAPYKRLLRMHRLGPSLEDWRIDPGVLYAESSDVQSIHAFMEEQLDPFSDQVPGLARLSEAVTNGTALFVRESSVLAGVLIFERQGFTTTLRYWYVDARFRSQRVGARLIRAFLRLCAGSRRILLWVVAGNDDAIAKYRHYGFRDDPLVDDIMLRRPRFEQ